MAAAIVGARMAEDEFAKNREDERKHMDEARRRREEQQARKPSPEELQAIARQRQYMIEQAARREANRRKELKDLFNKYDTNQSGKLEADQVARLLTDMDSSTPPGTAPSDEELTMVLKVVQPEVENALKLNELMDALRIWSSYTDNREQMLKRLKRFDKDGTGKLEKPQLKAYLVALNGGKKVTDEEVDWVLREADVFGDGAIRQTEMVMATTAWYVHPRPRKLYNGDEQDEGSGKCCTLQ